MGIFVKVCGITRIADARLAVELGADAIGLNFVAASRRRVSEEVASEIAAAVGSSVEVIGVIADLATEDAQRLRSAVGLASLQLHGHEGAEALEALLPAAFKAVRIGTAADVESAEGYGGDRLLVDAKVDGTLGGTGTAFDWSLVKSLAVRRSLILAGGLRPDNVASAVETVRPWGVDVASGVERGDSARRKDPDKMRAFIAAVRGVE